MAPRSITDNEIAIIKAMLAAEVDKTKIQAYFTHPSRPVNYGRITNIEQGTYGPKVPAASKDQLEAFYENWLKRHSDSPSDIAYISTDADSASPISATSIGRLFEIRGGFYYLIGDESDYVECKSAFHGPSHEKFLRSVAALANNKGGYVIFGVEPSDLKMVGIDIDRFSNIDISRFSMSFREYMDPVPDFEVASLAFGDVSIGIIYVQQCTDTPIISTRDNNSYRSGTIYFRYPGESRPISATDFRRLLERRDQRVRTESVALVTKAIEGGINTAVLNLSDGTIETASNAGRLDSNIISDLEELKSGKRGSGTPLLIQGSVNIVDDSKVIERTIREGIRDRDVLANAMRQSNVGHPDQYVLHCCYSRKMWLPIWHYVKSMGVPVDEVIDIVEGAVDGYKDSKRHLVDRLRGSIVSRKSPSRDCASYLVVLRKEGFPEIKNERHLCMILNSMLSLECSDKEIAHSLMNSALIEYDKLASPRSTTTSALYKAACRVDELLICSS